MIDAQPGARGAQSLQARWEFRRGRAFGELLRDGVAVLREDFDSNPTTAFADLVWSWACAVLNGTPAPEKVLSGQWRYANGFLLCGSFRVASLAGCREHSELSDAELSALEWLAQKLHSATEPHRATTMQKVTKVNSLESAEQSIRDAETEVRAIARDGSPVERLLLSPLLDDLFAIEARLAAAKLAIRDS